MTKFLLPLLLISVSGFTEAQTNASLKHFAHLDTNVYVGSKPHSDQDFQFLQSQHVRYILNARFLPFLSGTEQRKAKKYGMEFIGIPMIAAPIAPSRKHVDQLLTTMHSAQTQPIYLHCVLGRDRTSLLSGLYKIYFLGIPKDEAYAEMKKSGFRNVWFLHGLKAYFDKNAAVKPK